jgi:RES domain-containing protein
VVISRPAGILAPWTGLAYRHIPAGSPYSVLDFRFAGSSSDNRWNVAGEPTLYLAGDYGVVLAEYARHFDHERALREPQLLHARQLYRLGRVRRMPASYDTVRIPMEGVGRESWLDVGS